MNKAEEVVRKAYTETKQFYGGLKPRIGDRDLSYDILYGPPIRKPPILFIGYQPGGGGAKDHHKYEAPTGDRPWPQDTWYAVASDSERLAQRVRVAFDRKFLLECTGLNAIFIRAPGAQAYRGSLSAPTRLEIEHFCLPLALNIVRAIDPTLIVAIGFATLRLFGGPEQLVKSDRKNRPLIVEGSIADYPAIAIRHLTSSRPPPSNEDLQQIVRPIVLDRLDDERTPNS